MQRIYLGGKAFGWTLRNRPVIDRSPRHAYRASILLLAALATQTGCTPPVSQQPADAAGQLDAASADRETWDVWYVQGVKVGHSVTRRTAIREGDEDLVRMEGEQELAVERSGEASRSAIKMASLETPDGQVRTFQTETQLGPSPMRTKGRLAGKRMLVETTTAGQTIAGEIAWMPDDRGFFAVEESLLARPMKPGERRTLRVLQPMFNQVAKVDLAARAIEAAELLTGRRELLRIDATTAMPGDATQGDVRIESVYWTDAAGETLKMSTPGMNLVAYRSTKEQALADSGGAALDLNVTSIVKLDRPLARPHEARRIRYRVRLEEGDPARVFVNDRAQRVTTVDHHTAELTVRAVRPDTPPDGFAVAAALPADEFRQANRFIQSDDPRIGAMAREAAGNETDPWKTAVALEDFVHRKIATKNYSQVFATAADVAESLEGDCTEHAVLLAALARARGIPARVAIGLVYVPAAPATDGVAGGFLYHMWTEVYVAGGWVGLDGTRGQGGVGPAHLTLATSSLRDATAYSSMLPVAQVLGQLKIDVIEVE
jgi:transglutaminase-like putative cysteine protease